MRFTVIALAIAVITLLTALRAAWLWRQASQGIPRGITHKAGSKNHVVQIDDEATAASLLNAQAALWSGATAILSALTAIWGALGHQFI